MSMGNDDNDFQGQNLHLAGEGSSKLSPVLCPYALPKFDFDDGLQGHLRFDSLVENEVFLGIPSQEDNQWIEDFSRGSSGIEFSSSAAESCSISRCNNVWSEATSSESVEMLLKSVGQEEIVPGGTVFEESGTCHELGSLTEQMEPLMKQDDTVKGVTDSDPPLQTDEPLGNLCRLNDVEGTLKTQEAEIYTHKRSPGLDPNASSETGGIFVTDCKPVVDRKGDPENQVKVDSSVNESLGSEMLKDSYSSGMEIDGTDPSSQDIAASVEMSNNQDTENQVTDFSFDPSNCLSADTGKAVKEHTFISMEDGTDNEILKEIQFKTRTNRLENIPFSTSEVEAVQSEQHIGLSPSKDCEKPSSLPLQGDCNLKIAEGGMEDTCSMETENGGECELVDLINSKGTDQQFRGNLHDDLVVNLQGDYNLDGHAMEVGNTMVVTSVGSVLNTYNTTDGENSSVEGKERLRGSNNLLKSNVLVNNSEAALLPGVENKVSDGHGDEVSGNYLGDQSNLVVACSSTEFQGEQNTVEHLEGLNDASRVHKEDLKTEDHASFPLTAGSFSALKGILMSRPKEMCYDPDVSSSEKENAKSPNDANNIVKIVESRSSDKRVEPSSQGDSMKVKDVEVNGPECETIARNGPGAAEDQVSDHLDKSKKTEVDGSIVSNLSPLEESSGKKTEIGPVLELDKGASRNCAVESSHESADLSLPVAEICTSATDSEQAGELLNKTVGHSVPMTENSIVTSPSQHGVKANEISDNSSSLLEACPTHCDSAIKQDVSDGNHEEAAVGKNEMLVADKREVLTEGNKAVIVSAVTDGERTAPRSEGGGASAHPDKPNCGTPTSNSCIVFSQTEKDKKEELNESFVKSIPLSEATVQSSPQDLSGNCASKDSRSFTFEVYPPAGLSEREASKVLMIVEGSSSSPIGRQMDPKTVPVISHGSSPVPEAQSAGGGSKGSCERKTRRPSGKATGKESNKKVNHEKETTPLRQSERGDKPGSVSINLNGSAQLVQFEELGAYGNVEPCGTVPCSEVTIPMSNLPDLNTSGLPSGSSQQPFSDLQQVQLRAQIFVYGSLIQQKVPDEACMISAFGGSDGGRSVWEPVWGASMERCASVKRRRGRKSRPAKSEATVEQGSVARPTDRSIKKGALQSKVRPSPVGRASSKGSSSPAVNSVIPLSSPLWSMSTPACDGVQSRGVPRSGPLNYHQTLSPLQSFQTPPSQSFGGHNPSWLSQTPFPVPWLASPQASGFDANARFSVLPMTETVKLTPVKGSSAPSISGTKHASPSIVVHTTGPSVVAGTPSIPDMKKGTVLFGHNTTDSKARKRNTVAVSENLASISLLAQTQTPLISASVTSHLSTPVVSTPACFPSKGDANKIVTDASPTFSVDHPKRGEPDAEQKASLSFDSLSKVEEAKRHAEDAGAFAAAAVSECQNVWGQLDKQKNSGLIPDVEVKLASAAVAVAAAAAVAKVAAAAAKIASNAALQAKLMADEALVFSGTDNPVQRNTDSLPDMAINLVRATPASILKGGVGANSSSSIMVAAREAARRRVEAASAASLRAENLDAVVKAAELAAEAVSQAGIIVAMGNPLPLNELVEAGPESYWKAPQGPPQQGVILNNALTEHSKADIIEDGLGVSDTQVKERPSKEAAKTTNLGFLPPSIEASKESLQDHTRTLDGISSSCTTSDKDLRGQRSRRASDLAKTIGVVPESENGSRSTSVTTQEKIEKGGGTFSDYSIKEGSLVEVRKDGGEFKAAWYSANVLSLKDGKAFVAYLNLQSDEGSRQLKEWLSLEGEGRNAPRIRIDHRTSTMHFEGTRKRQRAAMGDYAWSVGDRVDAWIRDCWQEGVVAEKDTKDDATFSVHFPAEGEMSVVKAWHLRPTLIWQDGEWVEWSGRRERHPSSQGDTPQEKRLKLGSPVIEGREKDNISQNIEPVESRKPVESRLLPLTAHETKFSVGKNTRDESRPNALGTVRTDLQKEGSRVKFGVPKPGKKRKFMEVSKHYVADRSIKTSEPNDSVKLAKYMMPQGSGSRGWKNTKIDAKEKQSAESKTKVLKSGKPPSGSGRTLPQKDKFSTSAPDLQTEGTRIDRAIKNSVSTDKSESEQRNLIEEGSLSNTGGAAQGPVLFSSLALQSGAPSKKRPTSNAKFEPVNKGRPPPEKMIPEVGEPRRSNRRIQPTSRMLEGLQSSLMISKIPTMSHDKSHSSQNRSPSKGNHHS